MTMSDSDIFRSLFTTVLRVVQTYKNIKTWSRDTIIFIQFEALINSYDKDNF